jgi:ketosteroid isomerase-like protein
VGSETSGSTATAQGFADALDLGDTEAAAALLAEDVELVYPGETVRGRDTWREARAARADGSLTERVEDADFSESGDTVEMTARMVQRWAETGDLAHEQPVLVRFRIVDGLIARLEFLPGS